ncbi:terminase large subunit [Liquorilactobacillus nagelii]|uniref:terminase large subunit n=1 Tax=Liquorilactobacillus nagelii TaxID=82688 RepID=UPI0039E9470F
MPFFVDRVSDGSLIVGKAVNSAVKRHLNDLKKSDWRWKFDENLAGKAVKFMELLPDPKTGKPNELAPFQKFIIGSIYGWVDKNNSSIRRFTDVFISMARKNGKSLLISGVILYEFLFGKTPLRNRQLYTAANDRKQAGIIFGMVKDRLKALMVKDEGIKRMCQIKRDEIINLDDGSIIRSFSRDAGLVDGYEPHVAVVDEYANAKTTDMIETLASGQLLLPSYLTFIISTAGFDMNVPMFTQNYPYAKKVLSAEIEAERYFAFIAEQDSIEEVKNKSTWIKSNPLLDVDALKAQITDYLSTKLKQAENDGSLNSKLIKNFNIWRQAAEDSYMDIQNWNDAEIEPINIDRQRVWIGVDVGKTSDLFAISWMIPCEGFWYANSFAFVGTKYGLQAKIKADRLNYPELERKNECEITTLESGVIDTERVFSWLDDFVEKHHLDVQGICFDPYQYGPLLTLIEKRHPEWQQIEVRQGTLTLSMPTKQFRDDILEKRIRHPQNQILTSAVNNAVLKSDNNGVRIDKNKYANKIDALDALLDAYAVCFRENIDDYLTSEDIMSDDFGF